MSAHTRVAHGAENVEADARAEGGIDAGASGGVADNTGDTTGGATGGAEKVLCEACPVLCHISVGRTGACDRWGNVEGVLTRVDPIVLMERVGISHDGDGADDNADAAAAERRARAEQPELFVTGVGAGTTYPDYKPAPFIVASVHAGVDMVTVVTEGIFSYCSFKVKIDTDRYLGPEQAHLRHHGEIVGHVTTAEYGSQMLSIGGVHHLTGGTRREGRITCAMMAALGNQEPVEFAIDGGANVIVQAGRAPIVDGVTEQRMRVGCGSATIGIFAQQWSGLVDEVVVVDDHITGVLSEHQAGRCLGMRPSGVELRGRRSTPGRYFQVANPGTGWGGTDISDPLAIIERFDPAVAWAGLRLLMVSTTGEHCAYFVLDAALRPQVATMPQALREVVLRIAENCEPALASVLFVGGAGGSLRAGVTRSPVRLTQSIKDALVNVTCGGAPAYVWPGGGITVMVDVARMPARSFGTVPTPAIVAPIEFSLRLDDYRALGGHMDSVVPLSEALQRASRRVILEQTANPWPLGGKALLG